MFGLKRQREFLFNGLNTFRRVRRLPNPLIKLNDIVGSFKLFGKTTHRLSSVIRVIVSSFLNNGFITHRPNQRKP
nr:MAG TPA: hypothetical protein [Bacteriophage sp.]